MDSVTLKELVTASIKSEQNNRISSILRLVNYIRERKLNIIEVNSIVFKTLKQLKKDKASPFNLAVAKGAYIASISSIYISNVDKLCEKDVSNLILLFDNLEKLYTKNPDVEQYLIKVVLQIVSHFIRIGKWDPWFNLIKNIVEGHPQSLLETTFTLKMALNKDVTDKYPDILSKAQSIMNGDLSSLIDLIKSFESSHKLHPIWSPLIILLSGNPDLFEKFWNGFFWKDSIYCKSTKLKFTMLLAVKKIITMNNKRILKFVLCKQTCNIIIQVSQKKHKLYETYKLLYNKIIKFEFTNNQAKMILKIPISLMGTFPPIVSLTHFFSPFINRLQKEGLIKCMKKLYENLPDTPDMKASYHVLNFGYFLMKQRRVPCFECELEFIEKCILINASYPTPFSDERTTNLLLQSLIFCEPPLKDAENYKLYKKLLENFILKIIEILSSRSDANSSGQDLVAEYKMLLITCKKIFKVIKGFKNSDSENDVEILFSSLLFGTVSYQLFQIDALPSQLEDIHQAALMAFSQNPSSELYWFDILVDIMLQLLLIPSYSAHNLVQKILEKSSKHFHESTWDLMLSRFDSPDLESLETETQNFNQEIEVEDNECPVNKVKKSISAIPPEHLFQTGYESTLEDINLDSVDPKLLVKYDELLTKQLSLGKKSNSSKKQNEIMQKITKIFQTRIISCLEVMSKQELDNFTKLKLSLKIMKLTIKPLFSNNPPLLSKLEGLARSLITSKTTASSTNTKSIDLYDNIFKKYVKTANKTFTVKLSTLWAQWLVFLLKSIKVVDEKSHEQFVKNARKFVKSIIQKILITKKEIANPLFFEVLVSHSSDLVSSLKILKLFVQHLPKCKGTNKKIPTLIQIFNSMIILNNFDETKLASIYSKLFDHNFLSSLHVDANLILPNFINGIRNLVKKQNNLSVMLKSQLEALLLWTGLKSSSKDNIKASLKIFSSLNPNIKH